MAKQDLTASIALSPRSLSRLGMFVDFVAQATGESVETVRRKCRSYDGLRDIASQLGDQPDGDGLVALAVDGQQQVDAAKATRGVGPKRRIVGKAPASIRLTSEADARLLLARVAAGRSRAMTVVKDGVRAQLERFRFSEVGKLHGFRVTRRKTVWSKDPEENEKISAAWAAAVADMRPIFVEGSPDLGFVGAVVWPKCVAAVLISGDPMKVGAIRNQQVSADANDLAERIAGNGVRPWGVDGPFNHAGEVATDVFARRLSGVLLPAGAKHERQRMLERVLQVRGQAAMTGALRDLASRLPDATAKTLRALNGMTQSGRTQFRKAGIEAEREATAARSFDPFGAHRMLDGASPEDAKRIRQAMTLSRGVLAAFDERMGFQKGAKEIRDGVLAGRPMREIGRIAAAAAMEREVKDSRLIRNIMVDGCLDRNVLMRAAEYYRARPKAPAVDPRALMVQSFGFERPTNLHSKAALEGALRTVEGNTEFVAGRTFKKAHQASMDYEDIVTSFEKSARAIGVPGTQVRAVARSIAYPEGIKRSGLEAISALWHREAPQLDARRAAIQEEAIITAGLTPPEAFPHILEKTVEIDGVRFTPLRSARELVAEGTAMKHCVGGYADIAEKGTCMIAAVECAGGRSTVDFRLSDKNELYVSQNRSVGNADAPVEADAAARKLVSVINDRQASPIDGVRDLDALQASIANAAGVASARAGLRMSLEQREKLADLEFEGLKTFLSKPERRMTREEWVLQAAPARIADMARSFERKAGLVRQPEAALAL